MIILYAFLGIAALGALFVAEKTFELKKGREKAAEDRRKWKSNR